MIVVAILIIPFLAKIKFNPEAFAQHGEDSFEAQNYQSGYEIEAFQRTMSLKKEMENDNIILGNMLKIILKTVTKSSSLSQPLDARLLRRIFAFYGEYNLVKDDAFIEEMISAASDGNPNPVLNVDTFIRGLTHDIQEYDSSNEFRFQTHYEDVFGLLTTDKKKVSNDEEENDDGNEASMYDLSNQGQRTVNRVMTFPQIDFLGDTFRSKSQYMFVWIAVVIAYFAFVWGNDGISSIEVCDEEFRSLFGCQIARSIVLWLAVMVTMM